MPPVLPAFSITTQLLGYSDTSRGHRHACAARVRLYLPLTLQPLGRRRQMMPSRHGMCVPGNAKPLLLPSPFCERLAPLSLHGPNSENCFRRMPPYRFYTIHPST